MKIHIEAVGSGREHRILRLRNSICEANRSNSLWVTTGKVWAKNTRMTGVWIAIAALLFTVKVGATTYYVSSSAGSDVNSGTSSSSAWQTIAHLNAQSFQPGDSILFKRGDVWNESLTPPSSGSSGNPIAFDAYGSGAAPNLTGYYAVPSSAWVLVTGNAWKAQLPSTYSTINFCLFGSIWGQKVAASTANLTARWDFYLANGYVYVYAAGNPSLYYDEPIVPMALSNVPVININGQSWLTFQHLLLNWFDQYGVFVQGASDHLVFANMEADSLIPQGTQPLGFYVDESAPGPGDIKIYNDEAHLNYEGFRFDGAATAISMVNDKAYANRDGAVVDNTGAVTYSFCHFYASSLAVAGSTDVEWTSGSGPTAGAGNIGVDAPPAVEVWQRYPAEVSLTVDDAGMTPGADTYYAETVLPVADAAGIAVGAAITVGYPLANTLISEFQSWIDAGEDVSAHSMSHTYYTNTNALDIQYTGSGTAASLSISGKTLTIAVTGASDGVSCSLAQSWTPTECGTILALMTTLNATGKFVATLPPPPCQGPYGTGCSAYTNAALLSQDLADVSGQDVKSSIYDMQLDVTRLTTDEISLSRQWMTTNLTGLPTSPVYVYPGGYETTTMQGITEGVPYSGARGALKEDLGVKDTYSDGFNAQNITSFGVNPSWMGITPTALNQHIEALIWKEQVWGVPWGIFWHLNELTQDDPVGGTEITNLIQAFKNAGANVLTNTALVNWVLAGTQETGSDGNYYYKLAAAHAFTPTAGLDFRPTKNSPVVDAGENLGTAYAIDIDGVNQNNYGSGWEIGAHVYQGYSEYGEGSGSGRFTIGGESSGEFAELPQVWVNNNEGNTSFSYELTLPNTWVTGPPTGCTFHAPYWAGSATFAGLQSAVNDIEACRTSAGAGIALDIPPALYTNSGAVGLVIPQSNTAAASTFLILRSTKDANLPNGQTVCSHGIQDNLATSTDIGVANPDCAGNEMYYVLGTTSTAVPAGAFTLANGAVTNTANYDDAQYMWTVESSGTNPSAITACSPVGVSSSSNPPLCAATAIGPDHWLIEDMEARMNAGNSGDNNIVNLTHEGAEISSTQLASHIHLRKIWAHGDWSSLTAGTNSVSAAISLDCVYCSVVDSQISEVLRPASEGHGIYTDWGSEFKINHNWIEGQSIGVFSGGFCSTPSISGLVPNQDMEMRRNRVTFPYAWLGVNTIPSGNGHWTGSSIVRKNTHEYKVGQRILEDGNIFENVDNSGGQSGPLADYNPRNNSCENGTFYQSTLTDITVTNNIWRNSCMGPETSRGGGGTTYALKNLEFENNLFYNIAGTNYGCSSGASQFAVLLTAGGASWQGTVTENSTGSIATFVANCSDDAGGCPGQIASGSILSAGSGCVQGGAINISAPNIAGGQQAAASTSCSAGGISAVNVTRFGSGYTSVTGTPANGTGTVQLDIQGSAVTPATGYQAIDINAADPANIMQCNSVTAFNQSVSNTDAGGSYYPTARGPFVTSGSTAWNGTPGSGNLTVSYPWTATASATDSGGYCKFTTFEGTPENFVWKHNTLISNTNYGLSSGTAYNPYGPNYQTNTLLRDSIFVGGGWDDPTLGEGTKTEGFNYDIGTMTADHLVWPGRAASSYTAYCNNPSVGCGSPVMYFPATSYCTGVSSSASCVGFVGAMSTSSMPLSLTDYHNFGLRTDSVFYTGGSQQASDGSSQGTNIPADDTAGTQNVYVCGTSCGSTGPWPD